MDAIVEPYCQTEARARPRSSAWLWRPWYAKLWWTGIPIWWLGMAASTRVPALEAFYDSAMAGFLNILFFPITALMILGVGYVQSRLATFPRAGDGVPISEETVARVARLWDEHERGMEDLHATTDMFDPRSGTLWIGNPLSSQWPNRRF